MRPTTSTMLQQNNNNNYPCLNMSGSTQEMLQKCSRAALPFPSRLELGDLPLIRGLRAWALCSRSRRKAGALLDAPHAAPAGVHLSGYGLPLGLDARQAEIGALVTVASLKTSGGGGKTQTQCLFLQTEKGSCLYSTAKPGSGGTASAGSSVVGGWLRGKTGRGSRDTAAGRRDTGPNPPAHVGANRVRAGSGRRWRKSGCDRARQQRSREDPGEVILEERKEVQDKGALELPRPPRCCHNASPKPAAAQCRRRAQRRESQEEHEGGESPGAGKKGARKQRQKEEEGGVCELGSWSVAPKPDPDSNPEDAEASGEADSDAIHAGNAWSDAVNGLSDGVGANQGLGNEMQSTEETRRLAQTASVSNCYDSGPDPVGAARLAESSAPLEGSICKEEQLQGPPASQEQCVLLGQEEPDVSDDTDAVNLHVSCPRERNETSASPLGSKYPSSSERNWRSDCQAAEPEPRHEPVSDAAGTRLKPGTWSEAGANQEEVSGANTNWRLRESADGDEKREDGGSLVKATGTNVTNAACADPLTSPALSQANPAPPPPPPASMATGLPRVAAEEEAPEAGGTARDGEGGREGPRRGRREQEEETGSTVATGGGRGEEEEEEFGVFMQAEGASAWSEGCATSASVPCGSGGSVDGAWTAFPPEPALGPDAVGRWWEGGDGASADPNAVFAEAFPSLLGPCDPGSVPTLTQLLGGRAGLDQGLLDSFHDLNKMIGWRCKEAGGASRDLLLKTLHLEQPHTDTGPAPWTANQRLSPGLPSANQHAVAKRRLSYDCNRNLME